jgi:DNA-directed RNA polymerase specialized sigma24 family protein
MEAPVSESILAWCRDVGPHTRQDDARALEEARRSYLAGDPRGARHLLYVLIRDAAPVCRNWITSDEIFSLVLSRWSYDLPRRAISDDRVDDLVGEVLLAAAQQFENRDLKAETWRPLPDGQSLQSWFNSNCILGFLNAWHHYCTELNRHDGEVLTGLDLSDYAGRSDPRATDAFDEVAAEETRSTFLQSLPAHLSSVAERMMDGSTQAEIARDLHLHRSTVAYRMRQVRQSLKRFLDSTPEEGSEGA